MLFSKPGEYKACGIFTIRHLILLVLTIIGIILAVKKTKLDDKKNIRKIIKIVTIIIWILEIIKIIFNFYIGNIKNVNTYIPLYYCSIFLYAGICSLLGKGKIKRAGEVFLATGNIVGGLVFLILPTTSLPAYPMFHYISLQSFIYHGLMVYIGIIINKSHYIELKKNDLFYYASFVLIFCILAFIINLICDSNLMFISRDFPNTPISIIYKLSGKLFPIVMSIGQMTLPFIIVYVIINKINSKININNLNTIK